MFSRFVFTVFAIAFAFCALPASAFLYAKDTGNSNKSAGQVILETVFDEAEKAIIEEYFGKDQKSDKHKGNKKDKKHKDKGLPPGLQKNLEKRGSLPPGLQKQLDENGRLPPGLEKKLPDDLLSRLPVRKGTKRVIVDNDVLLIEEGTRLVLDIIKDVIN